MKKISRGRKRRIYTSRIASLVLAATIAMSSSPLHWALAAASEQNLDTEAVDAEFTAARDESTATEKVEIHAFESREDVTIHGITLPDGTYVEGDTADFVVKENGDYDFTVVYDVVIETEDLEDTDDSDSNSSIIDPPLTEDPVVPGDSEALPEVPGEPINPDSPQEPEKPVDPDSPEEPEKPVDPDAPEEPGKPVEPGAPEEPGKPVEPGAPEEPGKPETPVAPVEPGKPETPVAPIEPETPNKEDAPAEPEKVIPEAKLIDRFIASADADEIDDVEKADQGTTLFTNHSRVFTYTVTDLGEPVELLDLGDLTPLDIPDRAFRQWIIKEVLYSRPDPDPLAETNTYNIYIRDLERIEAVKEMRVYDQAISDFTGIAYFTGLTKLAINSRQVTKLDLSNNTSLTELDCSSGSRGGPLTELDVSNNTSLTVLDCSRNQLTELNLSDNTSLTVLDCSDNPLTELDVSNNTSLTRLNCNDNPLTELDVSNNTLLTNLSCGWAPLAELDVSNNTSLTELGCVFTQLSKIDVSNNTALTLLDLSVNQLTELDVSNNTALTNLQISENQLTKLDVSNNTSLTMLWCDMNQLTKLDLSNNTSLTSLGCSMNQLTKLDVSNNTSLTMLNCTTNQLTELDVNNNTSLTHIGCSNNQLTSIDLANTIVQSGGIGEQTRNAVYEENSAGYMLNMAQFPNVNKEKVDDVTGDGNPIYDPNTGLIQFTDKPEKITYTYNTNIMNMEMNVTLQLSNKTNTVNKYTLTFNENNGTGAFIKVDVEEGNVVTKPNNPTPPEGMVFKFWATIDDAEYNFNTPVITNFTLNAIYEQIELPSIIKHTVTFDAKNETDTPEKIIVEDGSTVTKPGDPTPPEGMLFKFWSREETGGTEYKFETPVTSPFTLYAIYEQIGGGVIDPDPTPTPDPNPTPKPDPTPTPDPDPTPKPDPTPDPGNPGTGSNPGGGGSRPDRNPRPNPTPQPEPAPLPEITPTPIPEIEAAIEQPTVLPAAQPIVLPVVQASTAAALAPVAPRVGLEAPAVEEVEVVDVAINAIDNFNKQSGTTDRDLQIPGFGAEGSRGCILHWLLILLSALTGAYAIIRHKKDKEIEAEYKQKMINKL